MNLNVETHDSAFSNLFVKSDISLEFMFVKNLVSFPETSTSGFVSD